jgi:hypothetical protein
MAETSCELPGNIVNLLARKKVLPKRVFFGIYPLSNFFGFSKIYFIFLTPFTPYTCKSITKIRKIFSGKWATQYVIQVYMY